MDGSGPVPSAPAAANAGALDTLPKLLLRNAVQPRRSSGDAPQGLRHLADLDLGTAARRGPRLRHRPAQARPRARRRGGHHRRQPAAPLRHVRGRAEPRRHPRPGLPGLGGRRDGLRARARRGAVRRRARTRSRSTRSSPSPIACRSSSASSTTRSAGSPPTIRPACIPSSTCRTWGARRCAPTPAPRAGGSRRSPRARAPTSA